MKIDGFVIVTIICLMNFSNFNRLIDKIELKFENNFSKSFISEWLLYKNDKFSWNLTCLIRVIQKGVESQNFSVHIIELFIGDIRRWILRIYALFFHQFPRIGINWNGFRTFQFNAFTLQPFLRRSFFDKFNEKHHLNSSKLITITDAIDRPIDAEIFSKIQITPIIKFMLIVLQNSMSTNTHALGREREKKTTR